MSGHGSPHNAKPVTSFWKGLVTVLLAVLGSHYVLGDESERGLRLRLSFGGPEAAIWNGQIELPNRIVSSSIRILGMQSDQAGRIYAKGERLIIDLVQPTTYGGVEFEIEADPQSSLKYRFSCAVPSKDPKTISGELPLAKLASKPHAQNISNSENRIFLERAPGDDLKFLSPRSSLVYQPGKGPEFSIAVSQYSNFEVGNDRKLVVAIKNVNAQKEALWEGAVEFEELAHPYFFDVDAKLEAGVYEATIELTEPSQIPFKPPIVLRQRRVQFVVADRKPVQRFADADDNFELVYEYEAGKQELTNRGGRFKSWEKFNASAKKLLRSWPIASNRGDRSFFEIPSGNLQLFPLTLGQEQTLLKLEIEYEGQESLTSDLVIFDRSHPDHQFNELASNTIRRSDKASRLHKHTMIFWNRSTNPVLMVRNLKSGGPLKLSRISVFRFDSKVEEFKLFTNRNRRLFTQFSADEFSRFLAAPKSSENGQYHLDDWTTYQTGGRRLIQLLKSAEYQGLVIDINNRSSGLFPSRLLHYSPALDTGVFSSTGRDPIRKDVLELLFQQFDVNGLTLIPRIEIPQFIAAFESADSTFQPELRLKKFNGMDSSTYNFLNPHVETYVTEILLELVQRYSKHPSFGGVCLKLGANRQLLLPKELGYNDKLVDQFLNQQAIKLVSSKNAGQKRDLVYAKHNTEFRKWQLNETSSFLKKLNEKVKEACNKSLMLDFSPVYLSSAEGSLIPKLRKSNSDSNFLIDHGFEVDALSSAGLGMMAINVDSAKFNLADQRLEFALSEPRVSSELEKIHNSVRQIIRRTEIANSEVQSTPFENARYRSPVPNANVVFRKSLIRNLAANDVLFFLDSFELGSRSIDSSSKRIWSTYSQLPNVVFENTTKNSAESPVIVRTKTLGNQNYLYVLNQSPWPAQVTIEIASPIFNLRNVNGDFFTTLKKTDSGGTLTLSLEPYDLVAGRSDQKELKISEVKYSLPESLKNELTREKDRLLAKIRFLKTPLPISSHSNAGFELLSPQGQPLQWSWLDSETFKVGAQQADVNEGKNALRLDQSSSSDWGWMRSSHIPNKGTGRISVLVAMKSITDSPVPQVRLSIDGQTNGQGYYRFGSFSASKSSVESARIENKWKVFAVHFNDVPTDITNLRVGMDVFGKGSILVDDLRVFDRWFDAQDKEALSKVVSLAAHNISTGEYLKAYKLMNGYWPSFIKEYEIENEGNSAGHNQSPASSSLPNQLDNR